MWASPYIETFEGIFPNGQCVSEDYSNDGYDRRWDDETGHASTGAWGGWPAGGVDAVPPNAVSYPPNIETWMVCGPYDAAFMPRFSAQFARYLDLDLQAPDQLFVGFSDGLNATYYGWTWTAANNSGWTTETLFLNNDQNWQQVYLGIRFVSDPYYHPGWGVLLDDIRVWTYAEPLIRCGNITGGYKGLALPAYEDVGSDHVPVIRAGDIQAAEAAANAITQWVRLDFEQTGPSHTVDLMAYDRMVDTLCINAGISILGLLTNSLLDSEGWRSTDAAIQTQYRTHFAETAGMLAGYFKGRVTFWEVWNEPDDTQRAGLTVVQYTSLLSATYAQIKANSTDARVLMAAAGSAWEPTWASYFVGSTTLFNNGNSWPFDAVAVHPYTDGRLEHGGTDPERYLTTQNDNTDGQSTILNRFHRELVESNAPNRELWVTEIGWNSSKGNPIAPQCLTPVLVTEQEQAWYVKGAFDVLLNLVEAQAVKKVFWYQIRDLGVADVCPARANGPDIPRTGNGLGAGRTVPPGAPAAPHVNAWSFGLYRPDKVTPKPARDCFKTYPYNMPLYCLSKPRAFLPSLGGAGEVIR